MRTLHDGMPATDCYKTSFLKDEQHIHLKLRKCNLLVMFNLIEKENEGISSTSHGYKERLLSFDYCSFDKATGQVVSSSGQALFRLLFLQFVQFLLQTRNGDHQTAIISSSSSSLHYCWQQFRN